MTDAREQKGYSRDRTMWLNVITLALEDYYASWKRPAYKHKVHRPYFWSRDFAWVCSMAQIDPVRVRSNLTRKGDVLN